MVECVVGAALEGTTPRRLEDATASAMGMIRHLRHENVRRTNVNLVLLHSPIRGEFRSVVLDGVVPVGDHVSVIGCPLHHPLTDELIRAQLERERLTRV